MFPTELLAVRQSICSDAFSMFIPKKNIVEKWKKAEKI